MGFYETKSSEAAMEGAQRPVISLKRWVRVARPKLLYNIRVGLSVPCICPGESCLLVRFIVSPEFILKLAVDERERLLWAECGGWDWRER